MAVIMMMTAGGGGNKCDDDDADDASGGGYDGDSDNRGSDGDEFLTACLLKVTRL